MKVRIAGQDFVGFTHIEASRSFLNVAGKFTLAASPLDVTRNPYPIEVQQECEITVEDKIVLSGFVETIDVETGPNRSVIMVTGRDKTADIIDSTIDRSIFGAFTGPTTLKTICEQVVSKLGIKNILVIDNVGAKDTTFNKGDFIVAETGESAFDFLERYAKKRQVLLNTDGQGNLTIDRGNPLKINAQILNVLGGLNNNVVTTRTHVDTTRRFNRYTTYSQYFNLFGNVNYNAASLNDALTNSKGSAIDSQIRTSRQYVFVPDTPLAVDGGNNRALWEANYKKSLGFSYDCEVSDHTYNGVDVWELNKQVKVVDTIANVDSFLLLDTISFIESNGGNFTRLKLIPSDSYNLTIQEDYRKERARSTGNAYFSGA